MATKFSGLPDEVLAEAAGYTALCLFVNKKIAKDQVKALAESGTKLILCCSAGYDNVPIEVCKELGIRVGRVSKIDRRINIP